MSGGDEMSIDLDEVARTAENCGYQVSRTSEDTIQIALDQGARLSVVGGQGDGNGLGFDSGWHAHPPFTFETGEGTFVELDAVSVIEALAEGEMVVVELAQPHRPSEQWLAMRTAAAAGVRWLQQGDEIRVRAVGGSGPGQDTRPCGRAS